MLASLVHTHQYRQILTCSHTSSGFITMAPLNLVQILCSNRPYKVSPIYTTNPPVLVSIPHIWLQTILKHCEDAGDNVSRVLRHDIGEGQRQASSRTRKKQVLSFWLSKDEWGCAFIQQQQLFSSKRLPFSSLQWGKPKRSFPALSLALC